MKLVIGALLMVLCLSCSPRVIKSPYKGIYRVKPRGLGQYFLTDDSCVGRKPFI